MRTVKNILQYDLFQPPEPELNIDKAKKNKEAGIKKVVDGTNAKNPEWIDVAYNEFKVWLSRKKLGFEFMIEDARSEMPVMPPGSNRIFGPIALRAEKEGLIIKHATGIVKNTKANRCYATIWRKA